MAEWSIALCLLHVAWLVMDSSPEPLPILVDMSVGTWIKKGLVATLTPVQSVGVAPEVNLRITQARKHTKRIHNGFETQDRCHQRSKMGVSVAP